MLIWAFRGLQLLSKVLQEWAPFSTFYTAVDFNKGLAIVTGYTLYRFLCPKMRRPHCSNSCMSCQSVLTRTCTSSKIQIFLFPSSREVLFLGYSWEAEVIINDHVSFLRFTHGQYEECESREDWQHRENSELMPASSHKCSSGSKPEVPVPLGALLQFPGGSWQDIVVET